MTTSQIMDRLDQVYYGLHARGVRPLVLKVSPREWQVLTSDSLVPEDNILTFRGVPVKVRLRLSSET